MKTELLISKVMGCTRVGIPWRKSDLYEHIKKNEAECSIGRGIEPKKFMEFSTFERRLRNPEFTCFIECRYIKEFDDFRYVKKDLSSDECVFSKAHGWVVEQTRKAKLRERRRRRLW